MQENQRVVLSKKMLRNGLLKLMETRDVYDITVKEICDASGINRSTFYRHYNNQMELLDEIIDEIFGLIAEVNQRATSNTKDSLLYIQEALMFFYVHREYDSILLSKYFTAETYYKMLEQVMKAGYVSLPGNEKMNPVDLNYTIRFLCYGSYSVMREWIARNRAESPEKIAQMMLRLCMNSQPAGK